MKVIHLVAAGNNGGIQTLLKDYNKYSREDNTFAFMWYGDITNQQLKRAGAKTVCFEAKVKGAHKATIALLRYVDEKKPDAIVVHSSPLLRFLGAVLKMRHEEIDLYMYCHSAVQDQLSQYGLAKRVIYNFINKLCIQKCEKVIAISNYVKKTVHAAYKVPCNKVSVIYNSVDIEKFDNPIHIPGKTVKIVFIGRLVKVKGLQYAIDALSRLPENYLWEFHIVGDGNYRDTLQDLVEEKHLDNRIFFWGSRSDVPEILSQMDIFLHPCTWEEGFGIGIIEAMASGKLCICSQSGAIPEIIKNGTDGYLVEKCNAVALEKMLETVMRQRDTWQTVQENAKKTAQKYNAVRFAQNLDNLLEQNTIGGENENRNSYFS